MEAYLIREITLVLHRYSLTDDLKSNGEIQVTIGSCLSSPSQ